MNREIFKKIFENLNLSEENIEKLLNTILEIYNNYGEDFKIPSLSDNTEMYLIKDKNDFFSLESFLLNRIIRNICGQNILKNEDRNIETTFLNYLHIKNYTDFLKRNNIKIETQKEFEQRFAYLWDIREILLANKVKYIISKKDLKENLKAVSLEFLEKNKTYKKRASEEDIEISADTTIDEVILKSRKKHNAKEIRSSIERDRELLRFEEETRKKQAKFPEGTNKKQIERSNLKKQIKEKYFEDIKYLISAKYNIYLFANLNALKKVDDKYKKLFIEKIGKDKIFSNIFLESAEAYDIFEKEFTDKVNSLKIQGAENETPYVTINKLLNEIEYGNETTYEISLRRLHIIFLEDISEDLEEKYNNEIKEEIEKTEVTKETEKTEKNINKAGIDLKNSQNNEENNNFEFAENIIGDYLTTENKYQVSRRNEDEEYFIDLIHNILNDVEKVKEKLTPVNGLYTKSDIRQIIRMLVTSKLISFENDENKNFFKKLLNTKFINDILNEIKKNPYITALHRVAQHTRLARGSEEITRLEHDRKRFDDNIQNINNLNALIASYEKLIEMVKNNEQQIFTLKANREQILSKVENLDQNKKEEIFLALISLIKIIARQNNMYPTEEEMIPEGYTFNIDKKYINYTREELIKQIELLLEDFRSSNRKFENY